MHHLSLPRRDRNSNKGSFGKVLVIGGSEKYPGSVVLSAKAAYRVGAGLVTIVSSKALLPIYVKELPEATHLELSRIFEEISKYDAVLFGPGFGTGDEQLEFTTKLISDSNITPPRCDINFVIDADGLNNLVRIKEWWKNLGNEVVLTPHPGEMARLTGLSIQEIQSKRSYIAQKFAKKWNKIVVLKGAGTVIASPNQTAVSEFENPALATAGTGDVLSGIIAGLLAQGLGSFDAAETGVYVHGLAGEIWSKENGNAGLIASDIINLLPKAISKLKIMIV